MPTFTVTWAEDCKAVVSARSRQEAYDKVFNGDERNIEIERTIRDGTSEVERRQPS